MISIRKLTLALFLGSQACGCSGEVNRDCAECSGSPDARSDAGAGDATSENRPPVRHPTPRDGSVDANGTPDSDEGPSTPGNPCGIREAGADGSC